MTGSANDRILGPAGEAQWDRLRAQIDLAEGFWLALVFVASPRQAIELRERTAAELRTRERDLILIRPTTLAELRDETLPAVLGREDVRAAGCTWVEAVRVDPQGATLTPWQDGWDTLFIGANQKRDAIRYRLRGALVLALPAAMKPHIRETAPDLWSVRSIVIDIPAAAPSPEEVASAAKRWDDGDEPSIIWSARDLLNIEEARARAREAESKGLVSAAGHAHLRVAVGALTEGNTLESRSAAIKAAEQLRGLDPLAETEAILARSRAELRLGNFVAARDLALDALERRKALAPDLVPPEWLDVAGRASIETGQVEQADRLYGEAIDLARARLRRAPTAENQVDLFTVLDGRADTDLRLGRLDSATRGFLESALLGRELAGRWGDASWALHIAAYSMMKVGLVFRLRGEHADALAAFEEAARIWADAAREGTSLLPLRERSNALNRLGELKLEAEDPDGAVAAFDEAANLRRVICSEMDASERAVRRLVSSLEKLAAAAEQAGRPATSESAAAEARELKLRLERDGLADLPPQANSEG